MRRTAADASPSAHISLTTMDELVTRVSSASSSFSSWSFLPGAALQSNQSPPITSMIAMTTTIILNFTIAVVASIAVAFIVCVFMRRRTKRRLEGCVVGGAGGGLPTVLWRPRFFNYLPGGGGMEGDEGTKNHRRLGVWWRIVSMRSVHRLLLRRRSPPPSTSPRYDEEWDHHVANDDIASSFSEDVKKMNPSSITNILPRMERLGGPYGMYGTVYGVRTMVIHVAHPVPANAILRSSDMNEKSPAYDHFANFCGRGVFTADGDEWRDKRASVVHALFRQRRREGSGQRLSSSPSSAGGGGVKSFGDRLEVESNRAADELIRHMMKTLSTSSKSRSGRKEEGDGHGGNSRCGEGEATTFVVKDVVPLLQRATLGIIYRYLTHCDDPWREEEEERAGSDDYCRTDTLGEHNRGCPDLATEGQASGGNNSSSQRQRRLVQSKRVVNHLLESYLRSVVRIRMIVLARARSVWFLLPQWLYERFSPMHRLEEQTMLPIRTLARKACRDALPGSPLASLRLRESHRGGDRCDGADAGGGDDRRVASSIHGNKEDACDSGKDKDARVGVSTAMLDEAITLLFAGQDTSAATLSWTMHLLSLHPDVQDRAAAEVRDALLSEKRDGDGENVCGGSSDGVDAITDAAGGDGGCTRHNRGGPPNPTRARYVSRGASSAARMPYLDAVVKESMRLYPVAPFVVRRIRRDLSVPAPSPTAGGGRAPTTTATTGARSTADGVGAGCEGGHSDFDRTGEEVANIKRNKGAPPVTITLPRNSLACVWIYGLHRNGELWHRPDDFLPERWLTTPTRDEGQRNGAYMPFAAGPRNCLGQPVANVVLRILLARILNECVLLDKKLSEGRWRQTPRKRGDIRCAGGGSDVDSFSSNHGLRKDMQAGFTVLPAGGVCLEIKKRT